MLGYPAWSLLGESLFTLVHTADIQNVRAAFVKSECSIKGHQRGQSQLIPVREQGVCSSPPYRLLACGGGFSWVETRSRETFCRSKSTSIYEQCTLYMHHSCKRRTVLTCCSSGPRVRQPVEAAVKDKAFPASISRSPRSRRGRPSWPASRCLWR